MVIPNHKNETLSTLFAIKTLFSQNSISTDAVDNTSAASFFVLNIIYIGKSTFIHKYYSDYLKFHPMTKILPTINSAILAASLTMAAAPATYAVVARQGLITASQPDGTEITIRLEGDALSHRAYTSDGYLLTTDEEGYYVFAACGADGLPVATTLRAVNPGSRSAEMNLAISKLNQSNVTDAFNKRDSSPMRKAAKGPQKGPGLFSSSFPVLGEQKAIVILVEFSNNEFTVENPHDYFTRLLNEENFSLEGGTGSARDFYISNSSGKFVPEFDLFGPVKLEHPISYYGQNDSWGNDIRPHEMVIEACQALDEEVDFSEYDRDGDGMIDNVYVFYAGFGEADGGASTTIWPHSFDIISATNEAYMLDDVCLNRYACSNELSYRDKRVDGIGTFTHEFSHVMALPDLYATSYSSSFTPGAWNIMDRGSYNNDSRTPPNYSSFERYALDWMEPEVISEPGVYELPPLHESNKAYILPTEREFEYFLLENRQQDGFDKYIPGHGMLIWHVDFDQKVWDLNRVNNDPKHQYVDLVEADNKKTEKTRDGDSFPGRYEVTSITYSTKPALKSWDGVSPGFEIFDITESEDGMISFTVKAYEVNGVESAIASDNLIIAGNSISTAGEPADIYDLAGRKVATATTSPITLPAGLYITETAGKTHKFIIK